MSALGPKRTSLVAPHMSAFGVKRTCRFALHMSAFDPKRTCHGCALDGRSFCDAIRLKNRREKLLRIVKYDAECVTHTASNAAHAMPKIDPICASRTLNGPVVNCEGHPITLL